MILPVRLVDSQTLKLRVGHLILGKLRLLAKADLFQHLRSTSLFTNDGDLLTHSTNKKGKIMDSTRVIVFKALRRVWFCQNRRKGDEFKGGIECLPAKRPLSSICLLYTSDAADE